MATLNLPNGVTAQITTNELIELINQTGGTIQFGNKAEIPSTDHASDSTVPPTGHPTVTPTVTPTVKSSARPRGTWTAIVDKAKLLPPGGVLKITNTFNLSDAKVTKTLRRTIIHKVGPQVFGTCITGPGSMVIYRR